MEISSLRLSMSSLASDKHMLEGYTVSVGTVNATSHLVKGVTKPMRVPDLDQIVSMEKLALEKLEQEHSTETTTHCPFCCGNVRVSYHEWIGLTSVCENGCF
ncbi:hypothetical protein NZD89_01115 [Alicyclobacillus fastidiosus]|uniref:Uncharacterized protein n=1 Tax=Alicyclobacillus fastidiosus TaxID=392011 RepID=A0ABY6ZGZ5_9BACL|nr:hypothetical protein [Alicyclobacillus fastidiosus]WAH42148.1 hypothetical protein NZD89_01115 [Alicyclobacillus fastidiosus]GMA63935.1 hypothetical protein GCM10025859_43750 [Alicyclobacillus fastidiosus]